MNIANTIKAIMFLNSVTMQCNTGNVFNISLKGTIINANNYSVAVSTSDTTTITNLRYSRFLFDQTLLQSTQFIFIDSDIVTATNSAWGQLSLALVWTTSSNFFIGVSNIVYSSSSALNFAYDSATLSCSGSLTFTSLGFGYWNYRQRSCPATYIYYISTTGLCYTECPPYTYTVTAGMTCSPCLYSCYTCSNTTVNTNCTSCNPLDFRTLSGTSCPCMPRYYNTGVAMCAACMFTCATCSNGTACLTCPTTRSLVSGQCTCASGLYNSGTSPTCVTCSVAIPHCISCTTFASTTTCAICATGYYSSTGACLACQQFCAACSSASTCVTCVSAFTKVNGTCTCPSGLFLSTITMTCTACSTAIKGCTTCANSTNSTICMACNTANNFVLSTGTCVCSAGFYLSGSLCVACPAGCLSCTSATVCTSCNPTYIIIASSCMCDVANGYSLIGGSCQLPCSNFLPGCSTCSSTSNCTSCLTGFSQTLVLSGGQCSCPSGYVMSSTSPIDCIVCPTCCGFGFYYNTSASLCMDCSILFPTCVECT